MDIGQAGGSKQTGQMVRHLVIPSIGAPPREKRFVEAPEFVGRIGLPLVPRVAIVEHNEHSACSGGMLHLRNRETRVGNPLERARRRDDIELRPEREGSCVARFKPQVGNAGVFRARQFQQPLIAIHADDRSMRTDGFGNPRGNRTGATADIEDPISRPKALGQASVIPFESSASQDARIRVVGLGGHFSFDQTD